VIRRSVVSVVVLLWATTPALAQLRGVTADLAPLTEAATIAPGATVRLALRVVLPDGYHVQSNKPRDPNLIPTELMVDAPAGSTVSEIVFPAPVDAKLQGSNDLLAVFERDFAIGVRLSIAAGAAPGELTVPGRFRYQACNDVACFAPKTADVVWKLRVAAGAAAPAEHQDVFSKIAFGSGSVVMPTPPRVPSAPQASAASNGRPELAALGPFTTAAATGGYLGTSDFLQFVRDAENGVRQKGLFEGRGPFAILLIVFLGGLALNLTPCVLPMIPINLAIIGAGAQAGSRRRGLLLGGAYGAAMAAVYGVLGVVVILTAGTFGTINASPWFNLAITILFVILALAMFDVITIDFSRFSSRVNVDASNRGSVALAFGMGAVAALLAGACVAPVVIQVVLFSSNLYAAGTPVALALPFFLGIGMAVPWPIAGAGIAALPRPGAWMVRVKQVLGVLILVTAAYYGYETYETLSNRWVDASQVASSVEEKVKAGWSPSLVDGLNQAARDHKPVLIDMWATWCKNCLTMDKTTLDDASVKAALDGYVKIKFQAEDPDREPAKSVMQHFDAVGLPTYVILKPK